MDINYNPNAKTFYKDQLIFSYSNNFNPRSYSNIDQNFANYGTNNNIDNPINFETDLKKATLEFSKTKNFTFYNKKPEAFKKVSEINRKKIKDFIIAESKNLDLIEKIEKNKENKTK